MFIPFLGRGGGAVGGTTDLEMLSKPKQTKTKKTKNKIYSSFITCA